MRTVRRISGGTLAIGPSEGGEGTLAAEAGPSGFEVGEGFILKVMSCGENSKRRVMGRGTV